jgi:hypothetical protein
MPRQRKTETAEERLARAEVEKLREEENRKRKEELMRLRLKVCNLLNEYI